MSRRRHNYRGRTELRIAGVKRRSDARALCEAGETHARAAMYLGGAAVECRIKAIAMEVHGCQTLDELARRWGVGSNEIYTHRLDALARRLPSYNRFKKSYAWGCFTSQVNRWRVKRRYDPKDATQEEANDFLMAVDRVIEWLNNNN